MVAPKQNGQRKDKGRSSEWKGEKWRNEERKKIETTKCQDGQGVEERKAEMKIDDRRKVKK
jgi:hypothetical protein